MNTFRTLLVCSSLSLAACGGGTSTPVDSGTPPTDTPATGDTPASTDGPAADGSSNCYTENGAAALCPATHVAQPDMMHANFRITHIGITAPAALASPILGNVVNGAVHAGGFLWGISYDLGGNMVRTGALNATTITRGMVGQGLIDGTFHYFAGNAPAAGGAATRWDPVTTTITVAGDRVSTGMVMGSVNLPIFDATGALLTELPLANATITNVQLTTDRGCVGTGALSGGRFSECSSNWNTHDAMMMPYGQITAVLTVRAARNVQVTALMTTLCNLLAGANCDTVPQAMWTRQPDAMVTVPPMTTAEPGYTLTTEFAAVSARIN